MLKRKRVVFPVMRKRVKPTTTKVKIVGPKRRYTILHSPSPQSETSGNSNYISSTSTPIPVRLSKIEMQQVASPEDLQISQMAENISLNESMQFTLVCSDNEQYKTNNKSTTIPDTSTSRDSLIFYTPDTTLRVTLPPTTPTKEQPDLTQSKENSLSLRRTPIITPMHTSTPKKIKRKYIRRTKFANISARNALSDGKPKRYKCDKCDRRCST